MNPERLVRDMISEDRAKKKYGLFKRKSVVARTGRFAERKSEKLGREMSFGVYQHPDKSYDVILQKAPKASQNKK